MGSNKEESFSTNNKILPKCHSPWCWVGIRRVCTQNSYTHVPPHLLIQLFLDMFSSRLVTSSRYSKRYGNRAGLPTKFVAGHGSHPSSTWRLLVSWLAKSLLGFSVTG